MFSFWALLVLVLALLWILATTGTEILESSTSKFGACTLPSYGFPGSAFACAEWDDEKRRRNQPSPGSLGEHKSPDRPRGIYEDALDGARAGDNRTDPYCVHRALQAPPFHLRRNTRYSWI